jgi:hypothetical protein
MNDKSTGWTKRIPNVIFPILSFVVGLVMLGNVVLKSYGIGLSYALGSVVNLTDLVSIMIFGIISIIAFVLTGILMHVMHVMHGR